MLGFCEWDGEMLAMVCVDGVPGTDVDQFPDVDVGLPSMLCVARVPGVDAGDAGAGGLIGCCAFCASSDTGSIGLSPSDTGIIGLSPSEAGISRLWCPSPSGVSDYTAVTV
jgi:hypothetical protein